MGLSGSYIWPPSGRVICGGFDEGAGLRLGRNRRDSDRSWQSREDKSSVDFVLALTPRSDAFGRSLGYLWRLPLLSTATAHRDPGVQAADKVSLIGPQQSPHG
jgi:hypothetical protein